MPNLIDEWGFTCYNISYVVSIYSNFKVFPLELENLASFIERLACRIMHKMVCDEYLSDHILLEYFSPLNRNRCF